MKKCPYCAEEMQDEAIKCKYCGEFLKGKVREEKTTAVDRFIAFKRDENNRQKKEKALSAVGFLILIIVVFALMMLGRANYRKYNGYTQEEFMRMQDGEFVW